MVGVVETGRLSRAAQSTLYYCDGDGGTVFARRWVVWCWDVVMLVAGPLLHSVSSPSSSSSSSSLSSFDVSAEPAQQRESRIEGGHGQLLTSITSHALQHRQARVLVQPFALLNVCCSEGEFNSLVSYRDDFLPLVLAVVRDDHDDIAAAVLPSAARS